jgi:hypothetical protein
LKEFEKSRADNLFSFLDTVAQWCDFSPVQKVQFFDKEYPVHPGFRVFLFVRDELSLFPWFGASFTDSVIFRIWITIKWTPFAMVNGCFKKQIMDHTLSPLMLSPLVQERTNILLRIYLQDLEQRGLHDDLGSFLLRLHTQPRASFFTLWNSS